mgnify:CR=1 FL=1
MADISIIARRLKNGNVEYGWSGTGGYYCSGGIRLLAWYDNPADVDYLFGLGQTRLIGKKGSENGGFPAYLTHSPIGKEFWIGETEQDIFNEIMTDYTYFYDLDNEWYYITRGPFQIKIPLGLINNNLDENNDMVSLMTIHSAKGLEFPIVYLAGMEDGLFPSYMSISTGDESDIEEERRLCYVGITRAKETLIMSAARMRTVRGETQMNRTSRFVREIPKELLAESAQMLKKNSEYSSITGKDHMELPVRKRGQVAFNSYQREAISNTVFDKKTDSAPDYVVGDRVRHIKFGEGTVADMINGGRDYEVTVDFDTAGRKKMFAGFAKLVKI